MRKYIVEVQSGLNEVKDLLVKEGYEVHDMGDHGVRPDISVIEVDDHEYEGMKSSECRIDGNHEMFVVNAARYNPTEVIELIKNNHCKLDMRSKKYVVEIQSGLNEVKEYLLEQGYEVHDMGHHGVKPHVSVIEVDDYEYEGVKSSECRIDGNHEMFVVNAARYNKEEIVKLIEENHCKL